MRRIRPAATTAQSTGSTPAFAPRSGAPANAGATPLAEGWSSVARRTGRGLWVLAALLALVSGCATSSADTQRSPRWTSAQLVCSTPAPPVPPEVSSGAVEGVVLAEYRVTSVGTVAEVRFPYQGSPARLEHAAQEWLSTCKAPSAAEGWHRLGFGFHAPYQADPGAPPPIDWQKPPKDHEGYKPPVLKGCAPDEPAFLEDLDASELDVVIGRDGRVVEVQSRLRDDPEYLLPTVGHWAQTCRFSPSLDPAGQPVAARVPLPLLGYLTSAAPEVQLLKPQGRDGVDLSPPVPAESCGKPVPTDKLRNQALRGTVLVEFVIHSNGRVGEVRLRKPVHLALFKLVRSFLLACPYTPSKKPSGEPVPVKVIQPFTFKSP